MLIDVSRSSNPAVRRFTFDEMMGLIEADALGTERVQLIDGVIYRDPPQSDPHMIAVSRGVEWLTRSTGEADWVAIRGTLRLDDYNAPDPDLFVWPVPIGTPAADRPLPIVVIEVSDRRTYRDDAELKQRVYARFGIADYWIENLEADRIEVHRDPVNDTGHRSGWRYAMVAHYGRGQSIALLARPGVAIAVDDLLP